MNLVKKSLKPKRHSMIELSELHNDIPTKNDDDEEKITYYKNGRRQSYTI